jgi:outer membrane lipoprotein-sorting protein
MPPALPRTALPRSVRLLAPVLAVGVVAVGVTVPRLADASDAALPEITAAELLAAVSDAEVDGLSGTVVATSRLGLPELPRQDSGRSGAVTLPDLLAGSTTARVWKAGDDRSRIAVDAPFAEYDVVRDGREVWTFDSASSDVTHLVLPEPSAHPTDEPTAPPTGAATPEDVADALLASVEPTTAVSVGRAEQVAGRAAYELVLRPRDAGTLVDTVRVAVDGETSVPLRVQVFGKGQVEPAFEVAFTDVRFAVPDDAVFAFVPPAGSTVEEKSLDGLSAPHAHEAPPAAAEGSATSRPEVLGSGWSTVVELDGVELPEQAGLLDQLARPVPGGRVVSSALLSVLLLDDGRVLAGAVPTERLVELAGR